MHAFCEALAIARPNVMGVSFGGEEEPITPIAFQEEIVGRLSEHLVRFERFPGCGHGVVRDAPERGMAVIRDFIGKAVTDFIDQV